MRDTGERLARAIAAVHAIAEEYERRAVSVALVLGPAYFVEDGRRSAYAATAARLRRLLLGLPEDCPERARRALEHRLAQLSQCCSSEAAQAQRCYDCRETVLAGRGRAEALCRVARVLAALSLASPERLAS